jgi:hypothetical protein
LQVGLGSHREVPGGHPAIFPFGSFEGLAHLRHVGGRQDARNVQHHRCGSALKDEGIETRP